MPTAEKLPAIVLPLRAGIGVEGIEDTVAARRGPMKNEPARQETSYTPFQLDRAARLARVLDLCRRNDLNSGEMPVLKLCGPWQDGRRDSWMLRTEPFMLGIARIAAGLFHDLVTEGCADLAREVVAEQQRRHSPSR